ncbi:MAG: hypothetical protein PWQ31_650 [Eubacteriales bacterium]|nr:hypothetical protein [Eubacteriales bacterium]
MEKEKKVSLIAAFIYLPLAVLGAGMFFLATAGGRYTMVERVGGSVWVFLLTLIILMPLVIPAVQKRVKN